MKNRIASLLGVQEVSIIPKANSVSSSLVQRTYANAELDAFRDKLRAGLAKQAMDNTAHLALAEEHFSKIAPGGKAEYRLIVETYAKKALFEIMRGGI